MKENDNYNIHNKFQMRSTNIFGLWATTNIVRWQPPFTPNFNSLPFPYPNIGDIFFRQNDRKR